MAKGFLYFCDGVTAAERDQLLGGESFTAVIHHSPGQIRFDKDLPAFLLPAGQAFGPDGEMRWQPCGAGQPVLAGKWEILLICETPRPALKQAGWQETEMDVDDEESIILWGQHWTSLEGADENSEALQGWGWVQAQIGADLHYPVGGSGNKPIVKVRAKTYRQQGVVRLTRFVDVYAASA